MTQETTSTNGRAEPGGMDEEIARRVDELRQELRTGEERLRELDAEHTRVRDTVLRIEGAILALESLGKEQEPWTGSADDTAGRKSDLHPSGT